MKKVLEDVRGKIVLMKLNGAKIEEIMEQLNLSRSFVFAELDRKQLIQPAKYKQFQEEAVRLYTNGLKVKEVAVLLGSSNGTIGRIIAAAQVGRPKLGRPNPAVAKARRKSVTVDGLKFCTKCEDWKPPEQFPPSKISLDGKRPHCNVCHNKGSSEWRVTTPAGRMYSARKAREYEAKRKQATPRWADISEIEMVYLEARRLTRATSEAYTVDHIIPLMGTVTDELGERPVCGLHLAVNLRVMSRALNAQKGNKHKEN